MADNEIMGGTVTYGGQEYPATIGVFAIQQVLDDGGLSPKLLASVTVSRGDFPGGTRFKSLDAVRVSPNRGPQRNCFIHSIDDSGGLVTLTVHDANEGA